MKTILLILIFTLAAAAAFGQTTERRIEEIRKLYSETNGLIAEMQKAPELSSVFAVELVVNKFSAPYPAVGIYQTAATFYYTYGDRERNPYPDRLLKVRTVTQRSARERAAEYFFDSTGHLVFVVISVPGGEVEATRLYFAAGRLIKLIEDGKETGVTTRPAVAASTQAKKEAGRLIGIFRSALASDD